MNPKKCKIMKKLLLSLFIVLASITANAQFYVGGQVGFSRNATDNVTTLQIAPEFGYDFNEKWAFGGVLDYQYGYQDKVNLNIFEISPYARYKFARVADDKLKFFVDGGVGFGVQKVTGYDTGFIYHIGFRPGMSYSFNEHWTILAHLSQLGWEGATDKATHAYGRKNCFTWNIFNWNDLMFGLYYSF